MKAVSQLFAEFASIFSRFDAAVKADIEELQKEPLPNGLDRRTTVTVTEEKIGGVTIKTTTTNITITVKKP